MKKCLFFGIMTLVHCQTAGRDERVVAAENTARLRPALEPAGGTYWGSLTVRIRNFKPGMMADSGSGRKMLSNDSLDIPQSMQITVFDPDQSIEPVREDYTILPTLPSPQITPVPGTYHSSVTVTATQPAANAIMEFSTGVNPYAQYDSEFGVVLTETTTLNFRVCSAGTCSAPVSVSYQIESVPPLEIKPPPVDNTRLLTSLAAGKYQQLAPTGLTALLDEAKLRVLSDNSLLPDASLRRRFLAQRNDIAAQNACTTIARYLYIVARRLAEPDLAYAQLPDFPAYYLNHIRAGDITQDSAGEFVWLMNGLHLVSPYLNPGSANAFEYHRSAAYPTDYSLLQPVYQSQPTALLLRDSSNATTGTHTFAGVRTNAGFIMIDTYFSAWNGIEARGTAGEAWPFAYRFGPAGSRYLHYVYGY